MILAAFVIVTAVAVAITTAAINIHFKNKSDITKVSSSASVAKSNAQKTVSSSGPVKQPVKTTTRIPVLMYHSINYEKGNILRVPKEKFAIQMKWLKDNGYTTLSLDDLYSAVSNQKPIPDKSVVITFDDGYADNYLNAFPIIKQYHFKATVFMITSKIGDAKDNYLTADQIKEMDANGMRVECHTVTHPDLCKLSYKMQYMELSNSKSALESILGRPIYYIAYPSGKYNANSIKAAKKLGYRMCFKMNGGVGSIGDNTYEFPRAFVGETLQDLINIVQEK